MSSRLQNLDPGPVWVYLLSFGALFARFGYNFGAGDQDELVPYLSSLLDHSLFASDWFVQAQAAEIGVRTYVVWLLAPFCHLASIPAVFFSVYLICWILIGSGAYRVARRLLSDRVAAALAVFLTLGVLHKWTLGSNDLVYSMFVGEMIAWALALHALHQWLQRRDRNAAVLLGIATWFQLLAGLLLAGVLVLERIWDRVERRKTDWEGNGGLIALALFVVTALPAIIPIALQQLHARTLDAEQVFYILARFRNPFHHMFLSFGAKSIIRFAIMLVLGSGAFHFLRKRAAVSEGARLIRVASVILVACIVTAVFTEVWPVLLVAKFQAFKLTVVLKFLLIVVISGALIIVLPDTVTRPFEPFLRPGRTRDVASILASVLVIVLAMTKPAFLSPHIAADVHARSDLGRMESWIATHSENDAVFAVPPSNSTFRSNARRAIVIDYAAFPFDDADMITWFSRLLDVAPIKPPSSGLGVKPVLDEAYHGHTTADWMSLRSKYGIDFLLVDQSELTSRPGFDPVHEEGRWKLYRLPDL